jgi:hypothetical protein
MEPMACQMQIHVMALCLLVRGITSETLTGGYVSSLLHGWMGAGDNPHPLETIHAALELEQQTAALDQLVVQGTGAG